MTEKDLDVLDFGNLHGLNILSFTKECVKRGKMTNLEAIRLRHSVHIFVGSFGLESLDEVEVPRWFNKHCRACDQTDCPVYRTSIK